MPDIDGCASRMAPASRAGAAAGTGLTLQEACAAILTKTPSLLPSTVRPDFEQAGKVNESEQFVPGILSYGLFRW
jgi:hypothetical protein